MDEPSLVPQWLKAKSSSKILSPDKGKQSFREFPSDSKAPGGTSQGAVAEHGQARGRPSAGDDEATTYPQSAYRGGYRKPYNDPRPRRERAYQATVQGDEALRRPGSRVGNRDSDGEVPPYAGAGSNGYGHVGVASTRLHSPTHRGPKIGEGDGNGRHGVPGNGIGRTQSEFTATHDLPDGYQAPQSVLIRTRSTANNGGGAAGVVAPRQAPVNAAAGHMRMADAIQQQQVPATPPSEQELAAAKQLKLEELEMKQSKTLIPVVPGARGKKAPRPDAAASGMTALKKDDGHVALGGLRRGQLQYERGGVQSVKSFAVLGGGGTSAASHVSEDSVDTDKPPSRQRDADDSDRNPNSFRQNRNDFFKSLRKLESSPQAGPPRPRSPDIVTTVAGEGDTSASLLLDESCGSATAPRAVAAQLGGLPEAGGASSSGVPADPNMVLKLYTTEAELSFMRSLGWDERLYENEGGLTEEEIAEFKSNVRGVAAR